MNLSDKNLKILIFGLGSVLVFVLIYINFNTNTKNINIEPISKTESHPNSNFLNYFTAENSEKENFKTIFDQFDLSKSNSTSLFCNKSFKHPELNIFANQLCKLASSYHKIDTMAVAEPLEYFFKNASIIDTLGFSNICCNLGLQTIDQYLNTYPNSINLKIAKAKFLIYAKTELMADPSFTMQGVGILKEIEKQDSTNIESSYNLAILNIRIGKIEEARKRLKKLLHLQPQNKIFQDLLTDLDKNN